MTTNGALPTGQQPGFRDVIVVGAGPSGLFLTLQLARAGIPVRLVEMTSELDKKPRATHYGGPAVAELDRAGVGDEARARGFVPAVDPMPSLTWRKLDGTVIGRLPLDVTAGTPDQMVCLPLDQLGALLLEHIERQPKVQVLFRHEVVGLGQNGDKAWVDVETPDGGKTLKASYIVGCDGGNSQTYFDFGKFGWGNGSFVIDPEHFFMAARITKDGLWRVTYGEKPGLTNKELLQRQPMKFKQMLPGHPEPDQCRVVSISPYRNHQRLAKSMRVGRFLLAADAAHLCNPFGGLGLTGGIIDVGNLFDCLRGLYKNKADESILDLYSDIRRKVWTEVIDPISTGNMRRLSKQDPDRAAAAVEDPFLQACAKAQADPKMALNLNRAIYSLQHDFTQYHKKDVRVAGGAVTSTAVAG